MVKKSSRYWRWWRQPLHWAGDPLSKSATASNWMALVTLAGAEKSSKGKITVWYGAHLELKWYIIMRKSCWRVQVQECMQHLTWPHRCLGGKMQTRARSGFDTERTLNCRNKCKKNGQVSNPLQIDIYNKQNKYKKGQGWKYKYALEKEQNECLILGAPKVRSGPAILIPPWIASVEALTWRRQIPRHKQIQIKTYKCI